METDAISQFTRLARCWEKCSKTSQLTLLDSLVWNLIIFKNCIDLWQPYWNGTIYVSQVHVKKAWPTCALSHVTVTQTKLSSGSGVSYFLKEWSPGCKLRIPVSDSEGREQLAIAPSVSKFVRFTSRSEAEDQDYRAIWELIFSIPSKWNNRIHNGWLHWKNVLLKTF